MTEEFKVYEIPAMAVIEPEVMGDVAFFKVDKDEVDPQSDLFISAGIWLMENPHKITACGVVNEFTDGKMILVLAWTDHA